MSYIIFLGAVLSFLLAEIIKMGLTGDLKSFWSGGGMPSSHTAGVIGLVWSVFLLQGFSPLFVVAGCFAVIVIRDAVGVRYAVGVNADILSTLTKKPVKHEHGHTIKQMVYGAVVGVAISSVVVICSTTL